uniref:cellulase n=1 Tax=Rasamsonia emersonii TaxID=68825 RepID=Q8WZD7_RASEM
MKFSTVVCGLAAAGGALAAPAKERSIKKRASPFQWFGSNESGAEFGQNNIPGVEGTDYTFPNTTAIQVLIDQGMNIFRVPFLMERMVPNQMTGPVDSAYLQGYSQVINYITSHGASAVIDPHNYGRYYNNIISSPSDFQTFWNTIASNFADNDGVIFDTNNEYHDMDESLVVQLNQAAIDGIRAAGATSQYIFVEGNSWTGAWTWTQVNDAMANLTDPQNKIVYEMHQYLDSDGSGTSDQCVNATIGQDRVASATAWLKQNGKKAILGEFAGGANSVCESAVTGLLDHLADNTDVWTGAIWWAAGPWWASYIFSMEPPSGIAYEQVLPLLQPYL